MDSKANNSVVNPLILGKTNQDSPIIRMLRQAHKMLRTHFLPFFTLKELVCYSLVCKDFNYLIDPNRGLVQIDVKLRNPN